jgi:hypothetical protein
MIINGENVRHKLITDLPWPGNVKLKIKSDGTREGTFVCAVDSDGVEHPVEGVTSVIWALDVNGGTELATASLRFLATPVELVAGEVFEEPVDP